MLAREPTMILKRFRSGNPAQAANLPVVTDRDPFNSFNDKLLLDVGLVRERILSPHRYVIRM